MPADLDVAKYISFTTYRRSGEAVATPVWVVKIGDEYGFTTEPTSGKAKRLAHNPKIVVAVSDMRGRVSEYATHYEGTARMATAEEIKTISSAVRKKYGFISKAISLGESVRKRFGKPVEQGAIVFAVSA